MSKYSVKRTAGIGIGYTSIMVIFVIICLTVLAVLSYTASGANQTLNDKSRDYMTEYYSAMQRVDKTLFDINETIDACIKEGMFDWTFEGAVKEIEGVLVTQKVDVFVVTFSEKINESQQIYTEINVPIDNTISNDENFTIIKRQVVYTDDETDFSPTQNVWDGF